jgi:hypothetical protein
MSSTTSKPPMAARPVVAYAAAHRTSGLELFTKYDRQIEGNQEGVQRWT